MQVFANMIGLLLSFFSDVRGTPVTLYRALPPKARTMAFCLLAVAFAAWGLWYAIRPDHVPTQPGSYFLVIVALSYNAAGMGMILGCLLSAQYHRQHSFCVILDNEQPEQMLLLECPGNRQYLNARVSTVSCSACGPINVKPVETRKEQ